MFRFRKKQYFFRSLHLIYFRMLPAFSAQILKAMIGILYLPELKKTVSSISCKIFWWSLRPRRLDAVIPAEPRSHHKSNPKFYPNLSHVVRSCWIVDMHIFLFLYDIFLPQKTLKTWPVWKSAKIKKIYSWNSDALKHNNCNR